MCLIERLTHRTVGVNTKAYFTDIENVVDNSIMPVDNVNWNLPVNGYTLSPVSLENTST